MFDKALLVKNYIDSDALVSLDANPSKWSTGNGLLYTGLYMTILGVMGKIDSFDRGLFSRAVLGCQVVPGVYNRNPGRPDWNAHDDYVGVAAGSYFSNLGYAHDIVKHGLSHGWCYDNRDPASTSFQAWHGRFFGRKGFYYAADRQSPGLFYKLGISSGVKSGIETRDPGEKILTWIQVKVLERQNICPVVCDEFNKHIATYFGSIGGLLQKALNVKYHPLFDVEIV